MAGEEDENAAKWVAWTYRCEREMKRWEIFSKDSHKNFKVIAMLRLSLEFNSWLINLSSRDEWSWRVVQIHNSWLFKCTIVSPRRCFIFPFHSVAASLFEFEFTFLFRCLHITLSKNECSCCYEDDVDEFNNISSCLYCTSHHTLDPRRWENVREFFVHEIENFVLFVRAIATSITSFILFHEW